MARHCLVAAGYVKDGKLRLTNQDAFKAAIARMPNCRLVIRLEEHKDPLSAVMRGYWFGVAVRHVTENTGYNDREAHLLMKELHMPLSQAALRGNGRIEGVRIFDSSISDVSNAEMWELCENVQQWAAELREPFYIPDPNQDVVVAA